MTEQPHPARPLSDLARDLIHGVAEFEPTARGVRLHRLPASARRFADPQLLAMEAQPSGARLATVTSASWIELVVHPSFVAYRGADRPRGRVDVVIDGARATSAELAGGDALEVEIATGSATPVPGESHTLRFELPEGEHVVELWLPFNEGIELVDVRADAPLAPAPASGPLWVHHGSSISHGSNAAEPTGVWPVVAARRAGVELRSLGFGGSALVDPFMARVIRDAPADAISMKLGINTVNLDGMRLRTFVPAVHGFLDTIREGQPDTPLLLVSPIFCGIHEDTPGPCLIDPATLGGGQVRFLASGDPAEVARGALTLRVIRDALREIVEQRADDANLAYLDGLELYSEADAERLPLPDALHPGPEAHALIGERFAERAFGPGGALAAAF
ncbi:SGNH/GDSL hydrolase family protein [Schumannella luteola]|uniref:SGNH hydrolase-type esterase domain-containing protein n=1 Tax=Schumannella luteola TaxID=472059 RepID=A0A852Y5A0_9MICO|nr:GDSL-type esterase/lipase family protein [Schumannella luteola]NYG97403.1 hypothetical protein [Schumannella luteola]TPX01649.1 lipase [Schumannella luteola]